MSLPAIVLAAGASRRLGRPKQLVLLQGETLLSRTIRVTLEAGAGPVGVVLAASASNMLSGVDASGIQVVMNHQCEHGVATSIHAGLRWLQDNSPEAPGVLMLVCDQPGLTSEHLLMLLDSFSRSGPNCIVASVYGGIRGVPAILPRSDFPKLLALEGDQGAKMLLQHASCLVIEVPFERGSIDIDTPEDLARHMPGLGQW